MAHVYKHTLAINFDEVIELYSPLFLAKLINNNYRVILFTRQKLITAKEWLSKNGFKEELHYNKITNDFPFAIGLKVE